MTEPLATPSPQDDVALGDLEPPRAPIRPPEIEGLDDARAALEETIDIRDADVLALEGYRDLLSQTFTPGPALTFAWPRSWFIPGKADYRQHWPLPPSVDNRYDWSSANTDGGRPAGSSASTETGELFAWNNASALGPAFVGFARTGIYLRPTEQLVTYRLGADVDAVTEWRWAYEPLQGGGYGSVAYRSTAYLAAWQVDPATQGWELQRPFASRTLLKERQIGNGHFPEERDQFAFSDLRVDVQLQGWRTYAIGVSFEVEVTTAILDGLGKPYSPRPGDDIKLWASILGHAPRITAEPLTVVIP